MIIGGATYRRGQSFVPTFNAILGVRLIHECDLYSRQYGIYFSRLLYDSWVVTELLKLLLLIITSLMDASRSCIMLCHGIICCAYLFIY